MRNYYRSSYIAVLEVYYYTTTTSALNTITNTINATNITITTTTQNLGLC